MRTLNQYMPTMRETAGRWFFPRSSIVGTGVAVALLVCAVVFAYRYPTVKTDEAAQRLERFNALTAQATAGTQNALARLSTLAVGQPEWLQKVTNDQTASIQGLLSQVQPLTQAQILQRAEAQQVAWEAAQTLIAGSAFNGLKDDQIPLGEEGKAYLAALNVPRPSRFDYLRLADGIDLALPALKAAIRLQTEAEALTHRLDVKLNGDKAIPLNSAPVPALENPGRLANPVLPPKSALEGPSSQGSIDAVDTAIRKAEREAKQQQQAAETAAQREEQQAQRKLQVAENAAKRQQRESEAKAKAAAGAEERAKRQAERQAEQQRLAAQRAVEAKQRECTSSLMARAKCAAQGYNPLTGSKN